jgi:hypothetical protein
VLLVLVTARLDSKDLSVNVLNLAPTTVQDKVAVDVMVNVLANLVTLDLTAHAKFLQFVSMVSVTAPLVYVTVMPASLVKDVKTNFALLLALQLKSAILMDNVFVTRLFQETLVTASLLHLNVLLMEVPATVMEPVIVQLELLVKTVSVPLAPLLV